MRIGDGPRPSGASSALPSDVVRAWFSGCERPGGPWADPVFAEAGALRLSGQVTCGGTLLSRCSAASSKRRVYPEALRQRLGLPAATCSSEQEVDAFLEHLPPGGAGAREEFRWRCAHGRRSCRDLCQALSAQNVTNASGATRAPAHVAQPAGRTWSVGTLQLARRLSATRGLLLRFARCAKAGLSAIPARGSVHLALGRRLPRDHLAADTRLLLEVSDASTSAAPRDRALLPVLHGGCA